MVSGPDLPHPGDDAIARQQLPARAAAAGLPDGELAAGELPARLDTLIRIITGMATVVLFIALAAAWLIWRQQELAGVTACQVRYNTAYANAQTYRSTLTNADHDATVALITAVFTPPKPGETRAQQVAAIQADYQAYKGAEATITAERARTPVPPAPTC